MSNRIHFRADSWGIRSFLNHFAKNAYIALSFFHTSNVILMMIDKYEFRRFDDNCIWSMHFHYNFDVIC